MLVNCGLQKAIFYVDLPKSSTITSLHIMIILSMWRDVVSPTLTEKKRYLMYLLFVNIKACQYNKLLNMAVNILLSTNNKLL